MQRRDSSFVGNQQPSAAILQNVGGLCALEHGIDWDMHETGSRRRNGQDARQFRLAHPARDAIARLEVKCAERRGSPADLDLKLGVGQHLVPCRQRRSIRNATANQVIEREGSRIRRHAAVIAASERLGNDVAVTKVFD